MDEIKRKISEEFDESGDTELSDDLRQEIESSGELKEYADDLIRVEGFLHSVRDTEPSDPEWDSLHEDISKSLDEEGDAQASLLEAPMPDGSEDDSKPAAEPEPEAEPEAKPEPAKAAPAAKEEPEEPHMRMMAAKPAAAKAGESSGLINLGSLVEQHRKAMAPKAARGGLDLPPMVIDTEARPRSKVVPIAIVAGIVILVGIAAVFGYSRMKASQEPAPDMEALRAQLEKELEAKYKQQFLAELKAAGMSTAEAEAAAEKKAKEMAAAEAEKQAGEMAAAEDDLLAMGTGDKKKRKKKKKKGSGEVSTSPSAPKSPKKPSYSTSKKESKSPPKSAGDDLAALLEGATGKKGKKGSDDSLKGALKKGSKQKSASQPAPSPKPSTGSGGVILPKTLAKADIRKSMNKIKPRILKCGEGKLGTLMLALVVTNDGKVKSAKVTGKFATDPAGKCAQNVAKTAKFPPFQNPTASVTYPFVFAPKPGQ